MDLSKLQAKYEEMNKEKSGDNQDFLEKFLQLKMDTNLVRILPWRDDSKEFYAETAIHRIPPSKNDLQGQAKNVHCLKLIGQKCPICDAYFNTWKTINSVGKDTPEGKKLAKIAYAIKAQPRYYLNVLVRETGEVKILSIGKKLFNNIVKKILDEDYNGKLLDLEEGYDYKIIKNMVKGSDGREYPNYDGSIPRPKPSVVGSKAEIAKIMDELHDVHGLVKHEEYSTIKQIVDEFFNGPVVDNSGSKEQEVEAGGNITDNPPDVHSSGKVTDEEFLKRYKEST